jgi:phage terminase large subunit
MEITFKTKNPKQLAAAEYWIDDSTEEILYGGAKGGGKSYLGASLIFGDALIYPDTHYFIARKELIDLRKFTVPTVHEVFKNWGLKFDDYATFNGQDNCFNLYNGSKVFLISCKEEPSDPLFERFGSMQMTRGWEEEAGEIAEAAHRNLWLSIGRWKNKEYGLKKKLLLTANPKKGWMKRDFVDLFKIGKLPSNRQYIQAFATDNSYLPEDYLNTLKNEKDNVRRQRLWEGNWDYEDDRDSLVSTDALSDAFSNTIKKDGQKYMTVDIARLGRDSTVITLWDGLEAHKVSKYKDQSTSTTEQIIKDTAAQERIPYSHILIDEDGIGGGVVDHLPGVKGFTANSSPMPTSAQIREKQQLVDPFLIHKPIYSNLKAQCGWKLAELINEHEIAFRVPEYREEIITDLTAILRDKHIDGDGKKQLVPKEEVKQQIGRSPDLGDTILMRAWFELKKEALNEDPVQQERVLNLQKNRFMMNKNKQSMNSAK